MVLSLIAGAGILLVGVALGICVAQNPYRHGVSVMDRNRPDAYIQFDADQTDAERMELLDMAKRAVMDGRLSQSQQFQNHASGDR